MRAPHQAPSNYFFKWPVNGLRPSPDIAELVGVSSLESHGASHTAPFMPTAMQDIGTRMHKTASQFALIALT